MKILMIGAKSFPNSREGGIDVVVQNLAEQMVRLGHDVTVLVRKKRHQKLPPEYNGVKIKEIFTLNFKNTDAVVYSYFATSFAKKSDADIIHYHAEGNTLFLKRLKKKKDKVFVTIHGLDWKRAKFSKLGIKVLKKSEKQAVLYSNKIITLCKNDSDYFKNEYNLETTIIPNGTNEYRIIPANKITDLYGLAEKSYILFLARIVPEKGAHYLIDAYNQLDQNKIKLVIAGGDSHSKTYYDELKQNANNENIIFTGRVEGELLDELYSNSLFYVLPSDIEGMPLSLIEALGHKSICLCSNIDELTSINSSNCYYFEKGNVNDLNNKLFNLINITPPFKDETVFETWEEITKKTLAFYIR